MQAAPAIDLSAIPAAQRAAVLALMETVATLTEITRRQEHLIAELNHALHGKRSEKLSEDERQLAFEDLSIALAEVEAEKETRAAKTDHGAAKPAPKRTICGFRKYRTAVSVNPGHSGDGWSFCCCHSSMVMISGFSVWVNPGFLLFRRMLSPFSSMRWALWMMRSRMASAIVGSPII